MALKAVILSYSGTFYQNFIKTCKTNFIDSLIKRIFATQNGGRSSVG